MDLLHPARELTESEERAALIFHDWIVFWLRRLDRREIAETVAGRCQLVLRDEIAKGREE